jgi:uncharacterized protein
LAEICKKYPMAATKRLRKLTKRFGLLIFCMFLLLNVMAYMHAYKFTHFAIVGKTKVKGEDSISLPTKIKLALTGVRIAQAADTEKPNYEYSTEYLACDTQTECWLSKIPKQQAKGTVIVCHGYAGCKSGMLGKAQAFHRLGYNTLLIDFRGTKSSGTNNSTVGFKEAIQVAAAVKFLKDKGEDHIICFGTSMGAVAILKAEHDSPLACDALILECPFGSLKQTVYNRFEMQGAPAFPMADLMVFWGGVQNGFNGFAFNPIQYALKINCPVLLMSGSKDTKVTTQEIYSIYNNLQGNKQLHFFAQVGHNNFLDKARQEWMNTVDDFLHAK